jgi:hypothetical protein
VQVDHMTMYRRRAEGTENPAAGAAPGPGESAAAGEPIRRYRKQLFFVPTLPCLARQPEPSRGKRHGPVALYLRVSTAGQTVENQRRELVNAGNGILPWAETRLGILVAAAA